MHHHRAKMNIKVDHMQLQLYSFASLSI